MLTCHSSIRSAFISWLAWLTLAAGLGRADVLVMNNGGLLLGRVLTVGTADMEVGLAQAGSTTVRKTDVHLVVFCPATEEPDSFFKAGIRAERSGMLPEAMACYDKSVVSEPATAANAETYRTALRARIANAKQARPAVVLTDAARRRQEAERLMEEGRKLRTSADMATSFSSRGDTSGEASVRGWGAALKLQSEGLMQQGRDILTALDAEAAAAAAAAKAKEEAKTKAAETDWKQQTKDWLWIAGGVVLVLVVGRLLISPWLKK